MALLLAPGAWATADGVVILGGGGGGGGGGETLAATLVIGNTTGGTGIEVSAGDEILLNENATVPGGAPGAAKGTVWVRSDTPNVLIYTDDAGTDIVLGTAHTGDVVGPGGGATDDALARFDTATGLLLQDSPIIVTDAGAVSGATTYNGVTVETHATRHENGGADEVSVAGLSGLLADQQTPVPTAGVDTTAIHDDVAGEISSIAQKAVPTGADFILIEDAAAGNAKKHIVISTLPAAATDTLAATLAAGNVTGTSDLIVEAGDAIRSTPGSGGAGANLVVSAGNGDGAFGGGALPLQAGDGGATGAGGDATVQAGDGGGTSGDGGDVILSPGSVTSGDEGLVKISSSGLQFIEAATVPGPTIVATEGRIWVKNDVPNTVQFTDDGGTDRELKYEGSAPATHAASHQNGGGDEINVAGLSGVLADNQPAATDTLAATLAAGNVTGTSDLIVEAGDAIRSTPGSGAAGANLVISAGNGDGAFEGGALPLQAGDGGATGAGGDATLQAGVGGATSGAGGDVILSPGTVTSGDVGLVKISSSGLQFIETAAVPGPTIGATEGRVWVKTATPNTLQYTDDAGTDFQLGAGASLGSMVVVSGQPQTTTTTDLDEVIATLTTNGQTVIITAYLSMTEPGATTVAYAAQISSGFFRDAGTVAAMFSSPLVNAEQQAGGANIATTFTISGNDIKLNADVFAASATRDWNYFCLVQVN